MRTVESLETDINRSVLRNTKCRLLLTIVLPVRFTKLLYSCKIHLNLKKIVTNFGEKVHRYVNISQLPNDKARDMYRVSPSNVRTVKCRSVQWRRYVILL
jgi:hypothetical protein